MRIGFVGCGLIGRAHAFWLGRLRDAGLVTASVTACYDLNSALAGAFAEASGAQAVDSAAALLESVDAVWICTWTSAHLEIARAAAGAGVPMFCEKPLGTSLANAHDVAWELMKVPHQVGLVLRYAPVFRLLADEVASGRHGRVLAAVFRDDQYFPVQGMYGSAWRGDVAAAGGGTLLEHSIHDVDVLNWLLGEPAEVSARVSSRFGYKGIDDVAMVTLTYEDEVHASLASVWHQVLTRASTRRLEVFCERAMLWTDDDRLGPLHVVTPDRTDVSRAVPETWMSTLDVPEDRVASGALYAAQAKAFLDALESATPPSPGAATAIAAHRAIDAAYRSAADGGAPVPMRSRR